MTKVIFRKWARCVKGEYIAESEAAAVFALFPEMPGALSEPYCGSYQHVGQHGAANYYHCIKNSTPATPAEYAALKAELEALGYDDLKIVQRCTRQMDERRREARLHMTTA